MARIAEDRVGSRVVSVAGAIACVGSLAALTYCATTHIPAQLGVLGGLVATAVVGELLVRRRRTRPAR